MEEKLKKLKEDVKEYQDSLKDFDSRDCLYSDYDEYNFAECIINNKRNPCLKKNCPYIITFNLKQLENTDE